MTFRINGRDILPEEALLLLDSYLDRRVRIRANGVSESEPSYSRESVGVVRYVRWLSDDLIVVLMDDGEPVPVHSTRPVFEVIHSYTVS